VALPATFPDWKRHLLTDPQTSGGLLVACAPERAETIVHLIRDAGYPGARIIGCAEPSMPGVRVVEA
jgi:selenide, water dikinase